MSASVMEFSISRSGDYIDQRAAAESGLTTSQICKIKEQEMDLLNVDYSKKGHGQIYVYYKNLIKYVVDKICVEFKKSKQGIALGEEIPIVVSGGTSKVPGFEKLFEEEFMKAVYAGRFPIRPSKVFKAKDPLTAVAKGCYLTAKNTETK
jgi:Ethanolamine utilization protein EutJ (predicted chaperonin)